MTEVTTIIAVNLVTLCCNTKGKAELRCLTNPPSDRSILYTHPRGWGGVGGKLTPGKKVMALYVLFNEYIEEKQH
jgi:hypothetical protein